MLLYSWILRPSCPPFYLSDMLLHLSTIFNLTVLYWTEHFCGKFLFSGLIWDKLTYSDFSQWVSAKRFTRVLSTIVLMNLVEILIYMCTRTHTITNTNFITLIIMYKQQFLQSDWLRTCQLIPSQWAVQFHRCKTVKWKMIDSSDKIELGQTKWWKNETKIETLPKFQYKDFITKQNTKLSKNYRTGYREVWTRCKVKWVFPN